MAKCGRLGGSMTWTSVSSAVGARCFATHFAHLIAGALKSRPMTIESSRMLARYSSDREPAISQRWRKTGDHLTAALKFHFALLSEEMNGAREERRSSRHLSGRQAQLHARHNGGE
jgi:hypothetical protein